MERASPRIRIGLFGSNYADLNFSTSHLPDFENNQSQDGDGNYSIVVRMEDNTSIPQDLYLDFIIQDIDESPSFASDLDFNQTAPENQTHAATLSAVDPGRSDLFLLGHLIRL